jgi:hypothetical protein
MSSLGEGRIVVGTARGERGDAIDLVRQWFEAMADGDLAAAAQLMAPGPRITVSGGHRFPGLAEFVAYGAQRYASIRKQCDSFEACEAVGGFAVFVRGELSGRWADGTPFGKVRWCDRFLVQAGRIVELDTWSDLAETRLAP